MPIVLLLTAFSVPSAGAASFDQQINQLKLDSIKVTENKKQLSREAKELSQTVAELQTEIKTIDSQINQTTDKVAELTETIVKTEKDMAEHRTLSVLNQQDRSKLQKKAAETDNRVKQLTNQLKREKQSVKNLTADQKATQQQLAKRRDESARLIGLNREQQIAFEESVQANIEKIAKREREKATENHKVATKQPVKTPAKTEEPVAPAPQPAPAPAPSPAEQAAASPTYPWANAPFPNDLPDPWGMFQRQCVSYTAWKVAQSGRHMPYWGGIGNANQWDDNARAAGIPVDTNPRVGDVAVMHVGAYGHVMYVEGVNPDGTINISEYNFDLMGNYSERTISPAGLVFIHF